MDLKMKYEINTLIKHGFPEDVATIQMCLKYNKEHLIEELIEEKKQEQELLREALADFVEFKIEEKLNSEEVGTIIKMEGLSKK